LLNQKWGQLPPLRPPGRHIHWTSKLTAQFWWRYQSPENVT